MACFCGCNEFEKDPNGRILGCVKCTHGRQNHDEEFREAARKMNNSHKNVIQTLVRFYSPMIFTKTLLVL